jgi:type I restriction enzyme S subunit
VRGVTYSKADASDAPLLGYLPILRANNITDYGLEYGELVYVPEARVGPKQRVRKNDVVIAASSGSLSVVGKAAPAREDFNGGFGAFCKVLRPSTMVHPGYFAHFFKTREYRQRISTLAAGININNLRNEDLDDLEMPVPPMAEQRRIAAILDQAEALRATRCDAQLRMATLSRLAYLSLFGDPIQNPMTWPTRKLEDLGTLERGVSRHRPRNDPQLLGGQYPLIQTGEVANSGGVIRGFTATYSEAGLRQSRMWPAGTLCITIAANIAKTGILTFDACFPDSVVGFRAKSEATVLFVQAWLSFLQKMLEDSAPEVAQKNINLEILRELRVPVPPLDQQERFASVVKAVEAVNEKYRQSLQACDELFASLQHRAFTGQL